MSITKYFNREELIKLIKFGVTGVINTLIDFGVFTLLTSAFAVNMYAAQTAGYVCGMANSYLVNRKWTFNSTNPLFGCELAKFIVVNLITLALSYGALFLFADWLGIHQTISKILVTCITMAVNFVLSRLWVFQKGKQKPKENA